MPRGAEVLVDAKKIGQTTPANIPIKDFDYGSHEISVELEGYELVGNPQDIFIDFRTGLLVTSILFFYTPFPWIKAMQTGYKGLTFPENKRLATFQLEEIGPPPVDGPRAFEEAVRLAADDLFFQVQQQVGGEQWEVNLVADPVIDSDTGEVTTISRRIEELLEIEAESNYPDFLVAEMNSRNIDDADYVITGVIPLELYSAARGKLRHLSLSALDRDTGRIVAHSDVWISSENLDFELTPMYRDSPMYLKDKRVRALIATAKATAGELADSEYYDSLATNALLDEASRAYDEGKHKLALGLFARAAERSDGKVMKTFSGLYQTFLKLQLTDEAGDAFASLAELGMRNGDLSVKFLFNVDATDFYGDAEDLEEYQIWLQQIAKTIVDSGTCVRIVGHASHTGTEEHNMELSLRRAELIHDRLEVEAPGVGRKTVAIGRGYKDNIIGTGTDDARDAIDRRVEFKIAACGT